MNIKTGLREVPLARPWVTREDIAAVTEVLRTPWLSMGPHLKEFERAVARYSGRVHGVGVSSGTAGLHLCLAAAEIGPGDEVITSPFSFVASANCALYQGARPVFADIDPQTLAIDPEQVEARITPRTRALISVDVFGQPAPVERLAPTVERHSLLWVQDACESIGAERNGKRSASHGKAAVFAFFPNKQMTTGEGGVVVTDDEEFAGIVRSLANQGREDDGTWLNHVRLGFNYRLNEMSAALGLSQLRRLDRILVRRARIANWYDERLRDMELVRPPYMDPATTRMSWFVYVVRLDHRVDRPALMDRLMVDGVPTRPYFVPIHLQPLYRERFGYRPGAFPVTEKVAAMTLALPFFTTMTEEQVDYVCDRLVASVRQNMHGRRMKLTGSPVRG